VDAKGRRINVRAAADAVRLAHGVRVGNIAPVKAPQMKSQKLRMAVIVIVATAIIAVAAVATWRWMATPEAPEPEAPPPAARTAAPPEPRPAFKSRCSFEVGDKVGVAVRQRLRWTLDLGRDLSAPRPATVRPVKLAVRTTTTRAVRWRLDLRAIKKDDDGSTVFAARVSRPVRDEPGLPPLGPAGLDRPFLLRIGARCDVLDTARRPDVSSEVARIRQGMLADLSWRLPPAPGERTYDERQRDMRGDIEFAYATLDTDDGARLQRRVRAVASTYTFDPGHPTAQTITARGPGMAISVGDVGWFEALRREETLDYAEGGVGYGRLEVVLNAVVGESLDVPLQVRDTVQGWVWGDLFAVRAAMIEPSATAPPAMRDMPVAPLLADLRRFGAVAWLDPTAEVAYARDWCRANIDTLGELVNALRGEDGVEKRLRPVLLMGLRLAGIPQADHVLAGLIVDASIAPDVRIGAGLLLASSPDLSEPVIDRLRDLAVASAPAHSVDGRVGAAATALLGHVARSQRAHNPGRAERARVIVQDRLTAGEGDARMIAALAGIENTGDDAMAGLLTGMHRNPGIDVRIAVARAVRAMNPMTTREMVGQWMPFERHPDVRRALARSLVAQIIAHRASPVALRAVEATAFDGIANLAREGAPLARPALRARLAAEQGAEDANRSVVERLQTLLSGIDGAAAATPTR